MFDEKKLARRTLIARIEMYWIEYSNGSKTLEEAEEFQNWAIDEFLLTIRKLNEAQSNVKCNS